MDLWLFSAMINLLTRWTIEDDFLVVVGGDDHDADQHQSTSDKEKNL